MVETREVLIKVEVDNEQAVDAVENMEGAVDKTAGAVEDQDIAQEGLNKTTGQFTKIPIVGQLQQMIVGLKGVIVGLKTTIIGFKGLKAAIVSTGIGALIIGLLALVTFLTQTQKGLEIVRKGAAFVGAAFDVIVDRISKVGEAITNFATAAFRFLKGDLPGAAEAGRLAIDNLKDAVTDLGAEIIRETALALSLEDAFIKLEKKETDLTLLNAKRSTEIQRQILITRDLTKSFDEQREALAKATRLELAGIRDTLALQRERVELSQLEFDRAESTEEDRAELIKERIKLEAISRDSLSRQRDLVNRLNELNARERTAQQAAATAKQTEAALEETRLAKLAKIKQDQLDAEQAAAEDLVIFTAEQNAKAITDAEERLAAFIAVEQLKTDFLLTNDELLADERLLIIEQFEAKKLALEVEAAEDKAARTTEDENNLLKIRQTAEQSLTASVSAATAERGVLGKAARRAEKAFSIKETFIKTKEGALKAYAAMAGIPIVGPVLGIIAAAAVALFGANAIAQMTGISFAGGGKIKGRRGIPKTGDKMLIRVNPGEAIVNKGQQQSIGGAAFRRAGVPGFEHGGLVGGLSAGAQTVSLNSSASALLGDQIAIILENLPESNVSVVDINTGIARVKVTEDRAVF